MSAKVAEKGDANEKHIEELSVGDTFEGGHSQYRVDSIPDDDEGVIALVNQRGTNGWSTFVRELTRGDLGTIQVGCDTYMEQDLTGVTISKGAFCTDAEGSTVEVSYNKQTGRASWGERMTREADVIGYCGDYLSVEWADDGERARVYHPDHSLNGGLVVDFKDGAGMTIGNTAEVVQTDA